jgi:phosphohistidine phosphatase
MKTLYLLRHAKSSWDDAALADFDRPLNGRGKRAAPFMGELIARIGLGPCVIVSSPAVRARQTAGFVKEGGALAAEIIFDPRIYDAGLADLRAVVSEIDDAHTSAMLVGHNPGIEGLIRHLTGEIETMPTAALAVIALDIDKWSSIDEGCGALHALYRPKDEMK